MTKPLEAGDAAPDFKLPGDSGREISLSALRGAPAVVYFYPKDDTSGCTREAIEFGDSLGDFEALGASIIGISADSPQSHDKFRAKHNLSVRLASDEDRSTIEAYGVWVEKNMYGRKYMGIERATFLIDADGVIARVWRKVRVPGHVEAVLDAVRELVGAGDGTRSTKA